jgi:cellulose synthase (UDP-forming)
MRPAMHNQLRTTEVTHRSDFLDGSSGVFIALHTSAQRWQLNALIALWLVALTWFWTWWLSPAHENTATGLILNSIVLFWTTIVPGYFLFFLTRARVADPTLPLPRNWRVAMVVTKAPSEPFEVVRRTLEAMLAQRYPHDTWLADERPDEVTRKWCAVHGVRISTRVDRPDYHRTSWPRRTRCKEGNLAFFYDHHGYAAYEFVAQLDADHVPGDGYLEAMLRPFRDASIGYVSAPSICGSNAEGSWSARGRLFAEAILHGPLQAGHAGRGAPFCIGSHYAVRTRALAEIGGIGPELAEDHSTSLLMNAHGWRGAHALDAIAHGDGPVTFADMAIQEFQWSRSLVTILARYTPRHLAGLSPGLKAQFLFAQLWYPLFAAMMLLLYLLPLLALLRGASWVNIVYLEFLLHGVPLTAILILIVAWTHRTGHCRPHDAPTISWEDAAFLFTRWPWALIGSIAAVIGWLRGSEFEFRVTPKGDAALSPPPARVLLPYFVLSTMSAAVVIIVDEPGSARGFYVFALLNAAIYAGALALIVFMHDAEARRPG